MKIPSHTTVAAYAAMFIALGGTGYAATVLPKDSVSSRQIKDRSVRLADMNRSARPPTRARLAQAITEVVTDPATGLNITVHGEKGDQGSPGPTGPGGPAGQPGIAGYNIAEKLSGDIPATQSGGDTATCPAGQRVLGGGGRFDAQGTAGATMTRSEPTQDATGWTVAFTNSGPATGKVHVWAMCAEVNG